jgi:prevent-host-death family protein
MTKIPVANVKDNFSRILRRAAKEDVVVTVHGRPAAVIIGFEDEDDWLEYRLLADEKFLARVAESRSQYREGKYETLSHVHQRSLGGIGRRALFPRL